jgi:chromate transporter
MQTYTPRVEPADASPTPVPTLLEIFLAFAGMSIVGFGGVLPWAQRMLVEQRLWLTVTEFAEALALAQFLPGGNILNLSVGVGQRFRGPLGSIAAVVGLLIGPTLIMIALGIVYARYGKVEAIQDVLAGVAAGAAGLICATVAKLARPLFQQGEVVPLVFAVIAFLAVVLLKLPLLGVLAILAPASVAFQWFKRP